MLDLFVSTPLQMSLIISLLFCSCSMIVWSAILYRNLKNLSKKIESLRQTNEERNTRLEKVFDKMDVLYDTVLSVDEKSTALRTDIKELKKMILNMIDGDEKTDSAKDSKKSGKTLH